MLKVETKGLDELLRSMLNPDSGSYVAAVKTTSTSPGRDAAMNQSIFERQAREGRDPVFFTASQQAKILQIWQRATATRMGQAAKEVSEAMRAAIISNIKRGRSMNGKMKDLRPSYQKTKDRKYGRKPILEKTGQLIASLDVEFKKVS